MFHFYSHFHLLFFEQLLQCAIECALVNLHSFNNFDIIQFNYNNNIIHKYGQSHEPLMYTCSIHFPKSLLISACVKDQNEAKLQYLQPSQNYTGIGKNNHIKGLPLLLSKLLEF